MITLSNPRCEYAVNPLGIDIRQPRFTWELSHPQRGQSLSAYQVLAASSLDILARDTGDLWDSGKVPAADNLPVEYRGKPLLSRQRVYWKARAWDSDGIPGDYCEPAWFEMALLEAQDWLAEWIGFPAGWNGSALLFRNEFNIKGAVLSARAYMAGLGYSELYLNGEKADDRVLDPPQTSYARRILYTTYDITPYLREGQNVVGVIAADGWYGSPRLLLQMHIDYADGSSQMVLTGRSGEGGSWWQVAAAPIIHTGIYDGEIYDARMEIPGWNLPGSQPQLNLTWSGAMRVESPGGRLEAALIDPIRVVDTLPVKLIAEPAPGVYVFDSGQNLSGWARLRVEGPRGTKISLRFAESLYPDGSVNQENLRSARATDIYILKGEGVETWEPKFTYHGFRYIQVEGYPGVPGPNAIQARFVRSATRPVGEFACSHDLLNRIHRMVWWTEASNQHSIPTDCPQRDERMGWLNDLAARSEEAFYNFDMARFFAKFIGDITDAQDPASGAIPDTVPYRWGSRPADPVSVCYLLIPWLLYRHYGDRYVLERNYAGMKGWVDYLSTRLEDGILNYSYYGDWAPPVGEGDAGSVDNSAVSKDTPGILVSTAFYAYSAGLLAQIADILGKREDTERYRAVRQAAVEAFNRRFWDEQAGWYGTGSQSCNVLPLYMNLVPAERRARVIAALLQSVAVRDDHPTTGNLCTKYLLETLAEVGGEERALRLATHTTYPSWGYMLENGATTLWERWEKATGSGMNSHNHPMYGSVDSWLYKAAAGISLAEDAAAFNRFIVHPRLIGGLKSAAARLHTVQGVVESHWEWLTDEIYRLRVTVPVGCRAAVFLPLKDKIEESGKTVWQAGQAFGLGSGILNLHLEGEEIVAEVGSGGYVFRCE